MTDKQLKEKALNSFVEWRKDWNLFARDVLGANLDKDQQDILSSVQFNPRTSVSSGTARGKDFVTAVAALCFLYLTPKWNTKGELIENTKVALTAPTYRQVANIMQPEFARLFNRAKSKGIELPGRLVSSDIRTEWAEWYLTAFKADSHSHESWSGFHAVNTMFAVTEATGISDDTFGAIEGNLQGNSRILIVFNPNKITGYAANSQKGVRWNKFRLSSLTAPNVVEKKIIIPGQVDYEWLKDKIENWCTPILPNEAKEIEDDFEFEGHWYRPSDIFRIKGLGKFPQVGSDSLIPMQWIELANERWKAYHKGKGTNLIYSSDLKLGVDVAGMGRDDSIFCPRFDNVVKEFIGFNSAGVADHMKVTGMIVNYLKNFPKSVAFIDTIGEGAGVYSRLDELTFCGKVSMQEHGFIKAYSAKNSNSAKTDQGKDLTDITGEYTFANMRAYLHWAVRDWLDPKNNTGACLPPDDDFAAEATEISWSFQSNGKIIIEPKEDIKERLGKSPDKWDSLTYSFWPEEAKKMLPKNISKASLGFY